MRKLLLAASILTLAACTGEAPAPAEEEAVAEAPAPEGVVANGSPAGAYDVTNADGTTMTANINADGTYSDVAADGTVVEEGTYAVVDGKTCFTPTTEGATPMCFTESERAEDGSFTATPDEGDPVTVKPKAAG